jgi:hypothetical protein
MALLIAFLAYGEYLFIRLFINKYTNLDLDIFPDRYYDNPKKTWIGAGIFMASFFITAMILALIFGTDKVTL